MCGVFWRRAICVFLYKGKCKGNALIFQTGNIQGRAFPFKGDYHWWKYKCLFLLYGREGDCKNIRVNLYTQVVKEHLSELDGVFQEFLEGYMVGNICMEKKNLTGWKGR